MRFLSGLKEGDSKSEYLLPGFIDELLQSGRAYVDVLDTKESWFGVTYQEDKEYVREAFLELTRKGIYPADL